jgi:hypothetical protein
MSQSHVPTEKEIQRLRAVANTRVTRRRRRNKESGNDPSELPSERVGKRTVSALQNSPGFAAT